VSRERRGDSGDVVGGCELQVVSCQDKTNKKLAQTFILKFVQDYNVRMESSE
jgi:ABC-type branched-subunit amino acid transport system substrate-binding protein